jgi:hypothetical protein
MSAHFVMLRNFGRRDTYSRRSIYPGYNGRLTAVLPRQLRADD